MKDLCALNSEQFANIYTIGCLALILFSNSLSPHYIICLSEYLHIELLPWQTFLLKKKLWFCWKFCFNVEIPRQMNTPDGFIFLDTFVNVNILNIWTMRVTQYLTFDALTQSTFFFLFVYNILGLIFSTTLFNLSSICIRNVKLDLPTVLSLLASWQKEIKWCQKYILFPLLK